jgi:acyl-CoA synthetase (NDP forming)
MSDLHRLLRPQSVAVIGASADPTKTTGRPIGYLQRHGFGGAIWPVNPRAAEIGGLGCFPDVASLPGAPDVAIVLVGPERAEAAVRDLAARGCAAAIVLAGGYAESGEEGGARQAALRTAAGHMRLLGPNTIGLVNLADRIKNPIMFYAGADDFRTPLEQTSRMIRALERAGNKPKAALVKDNEGHGFGKTENNVELYNAIFKFLEESIGTR